MRVRILLLLALLVAPAMARDLRPRAGSGWAGFRVGSWVRIKRTTLLPGRPPKVTISKQSLTKVGKTILTLQMVSQNVLGLEQKHTQQLPRAGEAGPGEKQKVETLTNEAVVVAGKRLDCARRRTTVTGPQGKRIITMWTAARPPVSAKRTEQHYDTKGKLVYSMTRLLSSINESRTVGQLTVSCVKYRIRLSHSNGTVTTGTAFSSRDVPGGLVWVEEEIHKGATKVATTRLELLSYEIK